MMYKIPFCLRGKENHVCVEYERIADAGTSGFLALRLPFDAGKCVGYPMLRAYFAPLSLNGYEKYCGWIQILRRKEYLSLDASRPENISFSLDVSEDMYARKVPYFAYGYPAELFDAPCKNLNGCAKLEWTAFTYLVDPPSRMNDGQLAFLAGFSWGYIEDAAGCVQLLDFAILSEAQWTEHKRYALFEE